MIYWNFIHGYQYHCNYMCYIMFTRIFELPHSRHYTGTTYLCNIKDVYPYFKYVWCKTKLYTFYIHDNCRSYSYSTIYYVMILVGMLYQCIYVVHFVCFLLAPLIKNTKWTSNILCINPKLYIYISYTAWLIVLILLWITLCTSLYKTF